MNGKGVETQAKAIDFAAIRVDLKRVFREKPQPLDFIWPGFLARTIGVLFAPGATSKSFWALEAGVSVALSVAGGNDLLGLGIEKSGRVVYLGLEDPLEVIETRAHEIGKLLPESAQDEAAEKFDILPLVGHEFDIMVQHERVAKFCFGARLIILDTLIRAYRTLDENSNSDMSLLLSRLEWIARQTGAAILILHHSSKAAGRMGDGDDPNGSRGASAIVSNARCVASLSKMTKEEAEGLLDKDLGLTAIEKGNRHRYVRRSAPKTNYSAPIPDRWYRRGEGGVLTPANLLTVEEVKEIAGNAKKYAGASASSESKGKDLGVVGYEDLPF